MPPIPSVLQSTSVPVGNIGLQALPINLEGGESFPKTTIPLVKIPSHQVQQLLISPTGQLLCAGWKKRVYLFSNYVVKGPYKLSNTTDERMFYKNVHNTEAVTLMEDELGLPEDKRVSLEWSAILENQDNGDYYLVQKNVGNAYYRQKEMAELEGSKLNKGILIACPGSNIKTVQTLLAKNQGGDPANITPEIALGSLQYLYFRYILGIGDVTLRNILVRSDVSQDQPRVVAGVDMEEKQNSVLKGSRLNLILPRGSQKSILVVLEPYIGQISYFRDGLPKELRSQLENFGFNVEEIENRVRTYQESQ